jgi:ABC-type transport system involved in multi-copper enzyme maturation permease subunit
MIALGVGIGSTSRPFGVTGVVLLELIFSTLNLIGGVAMLSYYVMSAKEGLIFPVTLEQLSILLFVFGLLSFVAVMLGAVPQISDQSYVYRMEHPAALNQPQVVTRQYVTQSRTVTLDRWADRAQESCPDCGRRISSKDKFCDKCGSPLEHVSTARQIVASK